MESMKSLKTSFAMLIKWLVLSCIVGVMLGLAGGYFAQSITYVTAFRKSHEWMVWLLPLAGILIAWLYTFDPRSSNTNTVFDGVRKGSYVSFRMAPMIVVSTVLTHAFGGSAGREGAALQLGGSLAGRVGRLLKLNEDDQKLILMSGMAAGFSALFGTPLTAAVFAMEVVQVGAMHYAAVVPCAFSALIAKMTAAAIGTEGEAFHIPAGIEFDLANAAVILVLAVLACNAGMMFCRILHNSEHYAHKYIPNRYIRAAAGGLAIVLLAKLLRTTDYLGAGMNIIEMSAEGEVFPLAFILKIVFTCLTLGMGFKGGEIVPTLFIGGTFGGTFAMVTGMNPALCTCCGMTAAFCAVTNCPLSSLFLSFELFGFEYMPFFLISVAVSYLLSGNAGLYHSQILEYSKTDLSKVHIHTQE